jgi:transcriptional regulator with XRE-family HTH domain
MNMKTKTEEFEVCIPDLAGTGIAERVMVKIPLEWDEEVKQWLIGAEANQIIEDTKARHMGLLLPAQLKELRERYDYTQKEMGELFQVGEKSWTRWESGKHRPSRSINLLVRALYEGEISIDYLLKRAGKPQREAFRVPGSKNFAGWLAEAFASSLATTNWAESTALIYCLSADQGKSSLVEGFARMAFQSKHQGMLLETRETTRCLFPSKAGHRFEHENINISSQTIA